MKLAWFTMIYNSYHDLHIFLVSSIFNHDSPCARMIYYDITHSSMINLDLSCFLYDLPLVKRANPISIWCSDGEMLVLLNSC